MSSSSAQGGGWKKKNIDGKKTKMKIIRKSEEP